MSAPTIRVITPAAATAGAEAPLDLTAVTASSHGWLAALQRRNTDATLPHVIDQLEASQVLANLRRVVATGGSTDEGRRPAYVSLHDQEEAAYSGEGHVGYQFSDSDLHKTLEAVGWEIARTGTTQFDAFLNEAVALLEAAQEDDGYLNSWGAHPASPARWSDLRWGHELYVGGHLVQGAVALSRAGRPELLAIARRWADLVVDRFGPSGTGYCGHPQVESALVELARETGDTRYLETARAMVERRGSGDLADRNGGQYYQDHASVTEATEVTGHAVRQLYLDAAVADIVAADEAAGAEPAALREALVARWESAHGTKLFLTGAMGTRHHDEAFGPAYELSPDRMYGETCAAIADLMLSWRLLLLTGEARYADAMERVIFNALPAALSTDGTAFFYSNPLQLRSGTTGGLNAPVRRTPWYACACCPPNIARTVASLSGYVATVAEGTVTLQQYAACSISVPSDLGGGQLVVDTDYPTTGVVRVTAVGTASGLRLRLRVPSWAARPVQLNGSPTAVEDGYVPVTITAGETVELDLGMSARLVVGHHRADAIRGCAAVVRGPVVYCAEQADLAGADRDLDLESLVFGPTLRERVVGGGVEVVVNAWEVEPSVRLYRSYGHEPSLLGPYEVALHPYADWGNRAAGPMRVWLPLAPGR